MNTPEISRERVEAIGRAITFAPPVCEWDTEEEYCGIPELMRADILRILRWYQERHERHDEAPAHDADERAFKLIGDAASYLMPKQQEKVQEGLCHLRYRLAPRKVTRRDLEAIATRILAMLGLPINNGAVISAMAEILATDIRWHNLGVEVSE